MNNFSVWNAQSPSGNQTAVVRTHCPEKSKPTEKKWFIEVNLLVITTRLEVFVTLENTYGNVYIIP